MRAQCGENFFQCIRGVGVIDHHQRLRAATQTLHAPGRAFELGQHFENFVEGVIQAKQGADCGQHVAQVETAEQCAAQVMLALRRDQRGAYAVVVELRFAAEQVGTAVEQAVGDQTRLALFRRQLPAEIVVEVDHAAFQVIPGEQPGLGLGIRLHGAVVIQMITGQVGHHRHIERQRGDPALIQTVGRHFHGHGFRAGLFQITQGRLHRNRIRRGVQAAFQRAVETGTQRTDDAAMLAEQIQRLRDQLGHAGLAIGASDADQVQVVTRLTVKTPGNVRQLRRQTLDRNQRHVSDRQHGGAFDFISHGSRAALQGIGDMRTAIETAAGHGEKQVAGAHVAAVQRQFTDQQIVAGVGEYLVQT